MNNGKRQPKRDPNDQRISLDAVIVSWRVAPNKRKGHSGYWVQGGEQRKNRSGGNFFAVADQKNYAELDAAKAALKKIEGGIDYRKVFGR